MIVADVKNTPKTLSSGFMVARLVDGELWYYGTYEEKDRADSVAQEIGNGVVLENMQSVKESLE